MDLEEIISGLKLFVKLRAAHGVYPDARTVVSVLSANLTFVKNQEGRVIPHYISAVKNEQQRDFPKMMQETGRMSNQTHRAFLMKPSGTPLPRLTNEISPLPMVSLQHPCCRVHTEGVVLSAPQSQQEKPWRGRKWPAPEQNALTSAYGR